MKLKKYLFGTTLLVVSIILGSCTTNQAKKKDFNKTTTVQKEKVVTSAKTNAKLEAKKVCFVNNQFMGVDQIPVEVDGKTYYGCCQGCVDKIKTNLNNVRFAIDPLTGEKVDKALAYIVKKKPEGIAVLYFANEKNYKAYFKL